MKPEAIKQIIDVATDAAIAQQSIILPQNATLSFAGREYIRQGNEWKLVEPLVERLLPLPKPYMLSTLKGLIEYVKSNVDGTTEAKAIVHVASPTMVSVVGPTIGFQKQRPTYAIATFADDNHPFGNQLTLEHFMVWLRSRFVPTQDSEATIKALSGVKDGEVRNVVDTGLSQEISIKVGVDMTDRGQVKNPVLLQPYRTFREVEQPRSEFLIRLTSGEKLPLVTLHEADGGTWKVEAILKIAAFLREGLGPDVMVLS